MLEGSELPNNAADGSLAVQMDGSQRHRGDELSRLAAFPAYRRAPTPGGINQPCASRLAKPDVVDRGTNSEASTNRQEAAGVLMSVS